MLAKQSELDPIAGAGVRVVVFDADCGICQAIVNRLQRSDRHRRLRVMGNDAAELPAGVDRDLTDETIVVTDPGSGRIWTRAAACAEILRCLPWGRPLGRLLLLPGIHWLADRAYNFVARRRARISRLFGLTACRVEPRPPVR